MCQDERIKEACGVFGIYNPHGEDAASSIYYGLSSLQHRGQESCGIAVFDTSGPKGNMNVQRGMGLVSEVFKEDVLSNMKGNLGIGHVRYSTTGAATLSNAQPLVLNYIKGTLALAHNGNLVNTEELRNELAQNGAIFHTTTDSEVIAYYIARERVRTKSVEEAIMKTAEKIKGAYGLVIASPRKLIGVRLGVIPTGSGNDFARNLGILRDTREDLREITACIDQEQNGGKLQRIDLGKVSWEGCEKPRIFGISAGAGLDAIVCKKALHSKLKKILNRFHLGKLTYLMLTVQTLFSMRTFQANVTTNGETESYENMIFAAAMNLRAEGGGVPMAPESVPDDGKISLSSASGIPKWKTFFLLPLLAMGKQGRIRGFDVKDGSEIVMELDQPVVLHADGEYCGDVQHICVHCMKNTLWLLHRCTEK